MRKIGGIIVAILCLLLWGTPAYPQATSWEQFTTVGLQAYQRNHFGDAGLNFLNALWAAEKVGPQDRRVGLSLFLLAEVYRAQGKPAEAEPLFMRTMAIREKVLGQAHPDVAATLEDYAALLRKTDRAPESARIETRARTIRARYP